MDLDVWVSVNSGSEHNCALKYDGTAMCWGWRGLSKVGDGRIRLPSTPDWERDSQGGYTWRQPVHPAPAARPPPLSPPPPPFPVLTGQVSSLPPY
jgi:hypothetical protein